MVDIDAHYGNGTAEILDPDSDPDVFFASVHLEDGFPGERLTPAVCSRNFVSVAVAPKDHHHRRTLSASSHGEATAGPATRSSYRCALEEAVLPALRHFDADIIFISAGNRFEGFLGALGPQASTDPFGCLSQSGSPLVAVDLHQLVHPFY